MKNVKTLSAVALLTLLVAACDKPATTSAAPAADKPAAAAPAQQADAATDLKKFLEWQNAQAQAQDALNKKVQAALSTAKDPKELEPVLTEFSVKMNELIASLDKVDIQNEEVKGLTAKAKAVLSSSAETMADTVKLMAAPSEAGQKALQEKAAKLVEMAKDLEATQQGLQSKYAPAQQPAAAPAQK